MKRAGKIVATVLAAAREWVAPGKTTRWIDARVEEMIVDLGGRPAFKGYRGFPSATCSSVNEAVVHGIPNRKLLKEGDLLKLDVGVEIDSYYGDSAWTFPVGNISPEAEELCEVCRDALAAGIAAAVPGKKIRDIARAIEKRVRETDFGIVEQYVGHGIGRELHEAPQIPNYVAKGFADLDIKLRPGMVLAIEPMVNLGGPDVETLDDGWTVVTSDGMLSTHYEHTVWISEEGPQILTTLEDV
ncbi:MAG: methionine aminopeptidase [Gemmatimonadota bacterium]|nr:MAG: methionine aminopeptidase [Gemmatimonadota bacterium]